MGISRIKCYPLFPSFTLKMQFDVRFYLRLFDIREMLLIARVLAKASRFTIANGLRHDYARHLLPASQ